MLYGKLLKHCITTVYAIMIEAIEGMFDMLNDHIDLFYLLSSLYRSTVF